MSLHPAHGGKVRWTASAPPGPPRPRRRPKTPYAGPPRYPSPPRWGFPNLAWRWPTTVPGTASARGRPEELLRPVGTWAVGVLVALAVFGVLAAGAELWRYVLLVLSRDQALSTTSVGISDGLVTGLWFPIPVLLFAALVLGVWWLQLAMEVAAHRADVDPPRRPFAVAARVAGLWVLLAVAAAFEYKLPEPDPAIVVIAAPVLLIVVAVAALVLVGPIVAELEHVALRKPREERPRPSRLVLAWWAGCVLNAVLVVSTLWRRLAAGVQAMADAVFLTAVTHLAAALLAVLTVLVMRRIGQLLVPDTTTGGKRRQRVVEVRDAEPPPLRATRPVGSRR